MPFAATCMDLEIVIQSEVRQILQRQILHRIAYMWIQKNSTDELIRKAEIESQMQKRNLRLPTEKVKGWDEFRD